MFRVKSQDYDVGFTVDITTIEQDEAIGEVLLELGVDQMLDGIDATALVRKLATEKLLRRFMATICIPQGQEFDGSAYRDNEPILAKMKSDVMVAAVDEFLKKNASWFTQFQSFFLEDNTVKPRPEKPKKK